MTKYNFLRGVSYSNGCKSIHYPIRVSENNGQYFKHYYANGGNMRMEIPKSEYEALIAKINTRNGQYSEVDECVLTAGEYTEN
jgi:hypothetical protein